MERAFGPVFDGYGSSEMPGRRVPVRRRAAYHVMDPHVVMEFGESARATTAACEVILTNLDEYGMPLLRYRIGDVVVPGEDGRARAGAPGRTLARVHGRRSDLIETPDGGALLVPDFFGGVLTPRFPTCVQYQVAKTEPDKLEIRVVGPASRSGAPARRSRKPCGPHSGWAGASGSSRPTRCR